MEKVQLRLALRTARAAIASCKRQFYAYKLGQKLHSLKFFSRGKRLAFYLANDGEIDPAFAIKLARKFSCKIYLPCIKGNQLTFKKFGLGAQRKLNRFGIAEPIGNDIPLHELDIIFLPLVGFDAQGQRIGMGGGFYDRTLEKFANTPTRPLLIGLAFDLQEVQKVPADNWDIPLDAIVTPTRVIQGAQ